MTPATRRDALAIEHDIEEYDGFHCSASDNGFDVPEFDRQDYEYTAEQAGIKTYPVVCS